MGPQRPSELRRPGTGQTANHRNSYHQEGDLRLPAVSPSHAASCVAVAPGSEQNLSYRLWLLLLETPVNVPGFWYAFLTFSPRKPNTSGFFSKILPLYIIDSASLSMFWVKIPCFFQTSLQLFVCPLSCSNVMAVQHVGEEDWLRQVMGVVFLTELLWGWRNMVSLPQFPSPQEVAGFR